MSASDMYAQVRKTPPPKRDKRLWIALGLAALLLVAAGLPALIAVLQRNEFRRFAEDLGQNSSLSRRKWTITMEMDGETYTLEAGEEYEFFLRQITTAGPGRPGSVPDEPPLAVLYFSTGPTLELWSVKLAGYTVNSREYGLFVRYTYRDGKTYTYENGKLSPSNAVRMLKESIAE